MHRLSMYDSPMEWSFFLSSHIGSNSYIRMYVKIDVNFKLVLYFIIIAIIDVSNMVFSYVYYTIEFYKD